MAQPLLKIYSSDGLTLVNTISLSSTVGSESAPYAFRFVNSNANGAVDDAVQPSISAQQVDPDTGQPAISGFPAVDQGWIQMRALGTGSNGDDHVATGWKAVGAGRRIFLPLLPSGGWHDMEIKYAPPLGASEGEVDLVIDAEDAQRNVSLQQGHTESSRDGIMNGIGDGLYTALLEHGGRTASGSPDEFEHFGQERWVHKGIPYVLLAGTETHDNDAGDGPMSAGDACWARWSLGAGTRNKTLSDAFLAASPNTDDVPAAPEGEIDLGYTFVEYATGAPDIATGDITDTAVVGGWAFSNPTGLVLAIGYGDGRFDNTYVRRQAEATLTLPASQPDNFIWWSQGAPVRTATLAARPDPRAYLLCYVPTGSSSITMADLVDYRDPIGAERQEHSFFFPGTATAAVKAYGVHRSARTGYIRSLRGMILAAASLGSGNATSDELRVNFKINGTTVFTSGFGAGSKAPGFGGPGLAFPTSGQVDTAAVPEVLKVPPFAVFEAEMTIPNAFAGTAPSDLTLTVIVEVP